jgi:hypothetical protein
MKAEMKGVATMTDQGQRIDEATIISRSPSVVAAQTGDHVVMMSIVHGRYFNLDDIASDIWKRIEPPCSLGELVDRLAADYDADRQIIADDVRGLLTRMAEREIVGLT